MLTQSLTAGAPAASTRCPLADSKLLAQTRYKYAGAVAIFGHRASRHFIATRQQLTPQFLITERMFLVLGSYKFA